MRFLGAGAFFFGLLLAPDLVLARVFDLGKESFASYLAFTSASNSRLQENAFVNESSATTYSDAVSTHMSGEFGFVYVTPLFSWRFGFEVFKPLKLTGVAAKTGTTQRYLLDSDIVAYLPKIGLEMNLRTTSASRLYLFGYAGTASVTVTNTYSSVTISPSADFEAKYKGNAMVKGGGLGFEFGAFDTTSMGFEVGYRSMFFETLTYAGSVTDFSGAHQGGDPVIWNASSKNRELDFSGPYASFAFRWWLF